MAGGMPWPGPLTQAAPQIIWWRYEISMKILTFGMLKIEASKGILSKLDPILDIAFIVSYDVSFKSTWFDLIQVPIAWWLWWLDFMVLNIHFFHAHSFEMKCLPGWNSTAMDRPKDDGIFEGVEIHVPKATINNKHFWVSIPWVWIYPLLLCDQGSRPEPSPSPLKHQGILPETNMT